MSQTSNNHALANKTIAVTGASQGLGLAITKSLISAGANVALLARNQQTLVAACTDLGSQAHAIPCDITDQKSVQKAFAEINQKWGKLDALVNNAGLARPNKICETSAEEITLQLQTNIAGLIYCCQAALPELKKSDNARIINISSASARSQSEISHLGLYAATKAAVERLSDELRNELREEGIAVTTLSPGATLTDFASSWEIEKLQAATRAWHKKGKDYDGYMDVSAIGTAVTHCLSYPKGVCVDFLEIRPNSVEEKPYF